VTRRPALPSDTRKLFAAQGLRAFAYGFGALLLGTTLRRRGLSPPEVGGVLGAVVAGTVLTSAGVARYADRIGRRRCYLLLYLLLAAAGAVFALTSALWALLVAGLSGTVSADIVDSGPFTSLEQAMLGTGVTGRERIRGFGLYNAVAAAAGSLGALAAGGPAALRHLLPHVPADQRFFLLFVPVGLAGAAIARSLSQRVELEASLTPRGGRLERSRGVVARLAALFATDSFAGGFVVPAFIAYWLAARFDASTAALGLLFFGIGLLQTVSFLLAVRLAERFGLLATMVCSHLPSNLLLAAVPLAPSLPVAVVFLLARSMLSQMDVPTRQAYVMALVDPAERAAAAGYTNGARYTTRPLGPVLAGAAQGLLPGLPFVIAGGVKVAYDLTLWRWFRRVPLPEDGETTTDPGAQLPPSRRAATGSVAFNTRSTASKEGR
jgi:MFS family permease